MAVSDYDKIKSAHLKFAKNRGLESTYCPSEVARELFPDSWRDRMKVVREVADDLIEAQQLVVLQKGSLIKENATGATGPIRLRRA